jgi:hypothetical protein
MATHLLNGAPSHGATAVDDRDQERGADRGASTDRAREAHAQLLIGLAILEQKLRLAHIAGGHSILACTRSHM